MTSHDWLQASSAAGKLDIKVDLIIEGELTPHSLQKPWILPPNGTGKIYTDGYEAYLKASNEPHLTIVHLKNARRDLYELIENWSVDDLHQAEGKQWVKVTAAVLAQKLDVHEDYVRKLYKANPFRYVVKKINGTKTTLIRIAHPSDVTAEDSARMMAKFWRDAIGRQVSPSEFGCLVGIAKDFPVVGYDIFRTVVRNWSAFMACVKLAQHMGKVDGDEYDPNPENFHTRFLIYPSIGIIRRFAYVARDFYKIGIQGKLSELGTPGAKSLVVKDALGKAPDVCNQIYLILNNHSN